MFERFLLGLILIYFMILLILCKFRLLMAAMLENGHNGPHLVSGPKCLLKMDLAWFEQHTYQISCFYLVCKSSSNGYSYTRGRRFMLRLKLDQDLLICVLYECTDQSMTTFRRSLCKLLSTLTVYPLYMSKHWRMTCIQDRNMKFGTYAVQTMPNPF